MTISEIQTRLKSLSPYRVEIWEYSVSHGRLNIRATSESTGENLHIVCVDCSNIAGPFSWNDGGLELQDQPDDPHQVVIRDATAGFTLICGSLNARANVEPVYRKWQDRPAVDAELERRNRLLREWDGAEARIWEYTPTLSRLTVRVQVPERSGNLHAVCVGCRSITTPVHWEDCSLSIRCNAAGEGELLVDSGGEVAICCESVVIVEDVEPVYFRRSESIDARPKFVAGLDSVPPLDSREQFAEFLSSLASEFGENEEMWSNKSLADYLDALQGFMMDVPGYVSNIDKTLDPERASWRLFPTALLAARFYE